MIGKIKILIVEHDPNDIELIQYELKKGGINYLSEILQTEDEYRNALKNFIPDIILSDYSIPSFSGLAAFEIKEKLSPLTPFIFVSGTIGEENSIELIRNGATDFALKDRLFTLPLKVNRALKEAKAKLQKIKVDEKLAFEYKEKEKRVVELISANSNLKIAEEKINIANRLYYVISQINQLIVHTTDEQTLLKKACNIAVDLGKFRMAWIGMVDEKTKKIIPVAHAGEEHGYLSKIKTISVDKVNEGRGPTGTAFREGKYSVSNDIENNPKMTPWKTEALKRGYYSSIGLPIKKIGKIIGVFTLYAPEPNFFNDREIALLNEITDNISFALENFEKEEQRKKVEEAVIKERDLSNSIINSLPEIFYLLDETGKYLRWNKNLETISGYSAAEISQLHALDLVDADEKQLVGEKIEAVFTSGKAGVEILLLTKANEKISYFFEGSRVIFEGKPCLIGVGIDITERKRTEEALRITQFAFDSAGDSIQFIEPDSRIVYVNNSACLMLGYTPQELLELSVPDIDPYYNEEVWSMFFPELREKGSLFFETLQQAKDGRLIPVEIRANYVNFGDKEISCAFVRDITERKKAEAELIKAKEKAEESDRLKSAFLANMSHEIRTPMNGILGFADLLNEPNLTGKQQQEYIKIIEKSGVRMLNIINDIVDISKIEAGLTKVNLKASNINEQIEYIYTFFKPEVEQKGMQLFFKKSLASKDAVIKTDREKIYAILTNLVKNAIKYTNEGFIELGCRLNTDSKPVELEFFVKDSGIGVPKDRQEVIFERFIQADISNKMAYQGAGLGLSISKAYVELLGGKIWVESEEGNLPAGKAGGSIFYFTIPYHTESEEKNLVENLVPDNEANDHAKNLNILIVDDDKISRMLLTKAIKVLSKEIIEAMDGVEALEACKNNLDIDLVMMDINMPNMNGHEATRQIRQFNKNVIIIAQTANAFDSDRKLAMESGCNDFISKPIRKNELLGLINKYFNKEIIN